MIKIFSSKIDELYDKASDALIEEISKIQKETFIAIQEERDVLELIECFLKKIEKIPKNQRDLLKFCQTNTNTNSQRLSIFKNTVREGKLKQTQIITYDENDKNPLIAYNVKVRKIDILILSASFNSSIASLYNNSNQITNLSNEFIQILNPKTNKQEITITRTIIKNSICFTLFISETKRQALQKYEQEKVNEADCPVKLINNSKKLYVITNLK